jgi:hypothetical protein
MAALRLAPTVRPAQDHAVGLHATEASHLNERAQAVDHIARHQDIHEAFDLRWAFNQSSRLFDPSDRFHETTLLELSNEFKAEFRLRSSSIPLIFIDQAFESINYKYP